MSCAHHKHTLYKQISVPVDSTIIILPNAGGYFSYSTQVLAVNIIGKRTLDNNNSSDNGQKTLMYFINDGVFGSFNSVICYDLLFSFPQVLNKPVDGRDSSEQYSSIVWGQTCDAKDKVCEGYLPELRIGDWLYFDKMGGYTVGIASTFNGFPIPMKFHYVTESYR